MLVFVVLAPGLVFALLALAWLLGWVPPERVVSSITGVTFSASVLALTFVRPPPCIHAVRHCDLRELVYRP